MSLDLDCASEIEKTFENWRNWTKVNPTPLLSEGHKDRGVAPYVDVYVDDLAKTTYLAASAPYLECARIIKAKYTDETATKVVRLAIMVKIPAGYDPENNDWWYGRYDATGTQAITPPRKNVVRLRLLPQASFGYRQSLFRRSTCCCERVTLVVLIQPMIELIFLES